MREALRDFDRVEEFIKDSRLSYREAVIQYYREMGEKDGFTVRENFSVICNGMNLGKLDLIWVEPKVTFSVEFGNLDNVLSCLFKIREFSPNLAVLILSSKASYNLEHISTIIEKSELLEDMRKKFMLLDISGRNVVYEG